MTCVLCYFAVAVAVGLIVLVARAPSDTAAVAWAVLLIVPVWLYVHETRRKIREAAKHREP